MKFVQYNIKSVLSLMPDLTIIENNETLTC